METPRLPQAQEELLAAISKRLESRLEKSLLQQLARSGGMTGSDVEVFLDKVRTVRTPEGAHLSKQMTGEHRRKLISEVRDKLESYSLSPEGRTHAWKVSISRLKRSKEDAKYVLLFEANGPPPTADGFWYESLTNGRRTSIVLSQPYHFREEQTSKHVSISARVASALFESEPDTRPDFAHMLGPIHAREVEAKDYLLRFFNERRKQYGGPRAIERTTSNPLRDNVNLVLLRSGDPYPEHMMGPGPFIRHVSMPNQSSIASDMLAVEPFAWLRRYLKDYRVPRKKRSLSIAVLVMRYKELDGRMVTLIEGGHPVGTHVLARALVGDEQVSILIEGLRLKSKWAGFPDRLRMLFQVYVPNAKTAYVILRAFGRPGALPKNEWLA